MSEDFHRHKKATRYNRNSAFAKKQSGGSAEWLADMQRWCHGRWWFPRLLMLAWFAYMWVRLISDPNYSVIFDSINLAIHEIGHILWSPFGEFMMFLGGSITQCLAPVVALLVFYRQRDYFAMAFCFGWLSINLYSVAMYIGDARAQSLSLVTIGSGEPLHDWHYLLTRVGMLKHDLLFATMTRWMGALSMIIFFSFGAYQCWLMFRRPQSEEVEPYSNEETG